MPLTPVDHAQSAMKLIAFAVALVCLNLGHPGHAQTKPGAADQRNLQVQAVKGATPGANPTQRVALVIGNSAYKEGPLANPVNDARAIAKALQESGFDVTTLENADKAAMGTALRSFGAKLRGGGTGLFYYAGHGMQIKGSNYLIPVGANIENEDEVAYSAVDAQAVLDKMEAAGNVANIMILDACRNNPFARSTRGGPQGLAQMDAPVGTLVAYATSPGRVASDGAGANGLYTQHLLAAIRQPGIKAEEVFKQVRSNVRRDSQGKQITWESTSMEGDFYFRGGPSVSMAAAPPMAAPSTAAPEGGATRARYVVGDSWTFATDDLLTNKQGSHTHKVSAVSPGGDATMNDGLSVYTASGAVKYIKNADRERFFTRDQVLASQLRAGFKEPAAYDVLHKYKDGRELKTSGSGTIEVMGREKIVVPAGTFMAWRMKRLTRGVNTAGDEINTEDVVWFVPEVQRIVAREQTTTQTNNGKQIVRERTVLQSFSLADPKGMAAVQANRVLAASQLGTAQVPVADAVRPALPSNSAGFTVGDRWRYQVADKEKGEVVRNYARQVSAVQADGTMVLNDGAVRWDAKGNTRFDRNAERERVYSAGFIQVPPALHAGAKVDLKFEVDKKFSDGRTEKEQDTGTMLVKGQEKVKTPAGEFTAWRVEIDVVWKVQNTGDSGRWLFTGWYVPQLRAYVAFEDESRKTNGKVNRSDRHELTSFSVNGAESLALR
jgi:uncharacterized caspase-like protein